MTELLRLTFVDRTGTPQVVPLAGGPPAEPEVPVVVTGATSGIGFEIARGLARLGHRVVLVGRDPTRLAVAADAIARETGHTPAGLLAELSEMSEVRRLARELTGRFPKIRALVNSAGAIYAHRRTTSEGVERTFALNVLAPYLLTRLLMPALEGSGRARVVNLASAAHRTARFDLDDLNLRSGYRAYRAYSRSKLDLILLTREFARRSPSPRVQYVACHPGFVASRFGLNNPGWFRVGWRLATFLAGISPERGARTPLSLLRAPPTGLESGGYYSRGRLRRPSRAAEDPQAARSLWDACAVMVGLGGDARIDGGDPPHQRL